MAYNDVFSCVLNNGHVSTFFPLHRGVHQGCPLSGILFVLGIELFARALKNNASIKGIQVNNHEVKAVQYADDTTIFVHDRELVHELLSFLQEFSSHSGLEIWLKLRQCGWGSEKITRNLPLVSNGPKEPILSLGVFLKT